MSHRRIPRRHAALAAGGAVGIAAAAVLLPHANASQSGTDPGPAATARTMSAAAAVGLVRRLGAGLGDTYGGAYYDAGKRQLVVNVVGGDRASADRVSREGAVPRTVRNSTRALAAATRTLGRRATVPGTSWAIDPRSNQVVVTADRTVTGDRWDRLESAVRELGGGMARIRKSAGEFKPFVAGGDAIFGGGSRCSLGFNVTTGDGRSAFLTAGHCGVAARQWSADQNGAPVGTVQRAVFPGDGDFALVTYDDPGTEAPSTVDVGGGRTVEIQRAADATVGGQVFRMGSTTGLHDGQVTGLDATVNYPEGTVSGLIQTNVCAEPGDSGGSLFTRDGAAVGLTSGGSGDCAAGGETFFQPVTTALAAVGARIGADGGGGDQTGGAGDDGDAQAGGTGDGGAQNGGTGDGGAASGGGDDTSGGAGGDGGMGDDSGTGDGGDSGAMTGEADGGDGAGSGEPGGGAAAGGDAYGHGGASGSGRAPAGGGQR
ncbi:S1 family peptidase [Streptomyces sp. LP05-1]|uniref:S1 family peptidase n=1 Tax=Streptomyces pyxinae TaxID=2970734 RepID=A0ABT2CMA6_9ACTN|nr:S1 family peptidase [Streptomyces sp. LP05-1]MCS0638391.1 S1 family peptidase [Streptomyces sp. LP05-1]